MNYGKMLDAYSNSEKKAVIEAEDSHAMVLLLFDELIKTARIFFSKNINADTGDLKLRSETMSKALTIIYALQSSLDFERGGEIAENLYRLYEYTREQILIDNKSGKAAGILVAISSLEDIREAWVEIRSIL